MKSILKSITLILMLLSILIKVSSCKKDSKDTNPPSEVSDLKAIIGVSTITLTWSDPSDKDLNVIEISYNDSVFVVFKGIQSKEISYLETGKEYIFTLKTIDVSGNKSSGVQIHGILDYRLKYIGDFKFFSYNWWSSMGHTTYSDTMIFTGRVSIIDNSDSLIQIRYRPGGQTTICGTDSVFGAHIEPLINATGNLSYPKVLYCSNQSYFHGHFNQTDSLIISIGSGGLGAQYGQSIIGIRNK